MIVFKNNLEEVDQSTNNDDFKPKQFRINDMTVNLTKNYIQFREIFSNLNDDQDQSELAQFSIPDLIQKRFVEQTKTKRRCSDSNSDSDDNYSYEYSNYSRNYEAKSDENVFKSNFDGCNIDDEKYIKKRNRGPYISYFDNYYYDEEYNYPQSFSSSGTDYYNNKMLLKSKLPKPQYIKEESKKNTIAKSIAIEQFQLILDGHDIIIPDFLVEDMLKIAEKFEFQDLIDELSQFKEEMQDLEHYNKFSELDILINLQELLTSIDEESFQAESSIVYSIYLYIGTELFESTLRYFSYLYPKKYPIFTQIAKMIDNKYSNFVFYVDFSERKSSTSRRYAFYESSHINDALGSYIMEDDVDSLQKLSSNPKFQFTKELVLLKIDNSFKSMKINIECNAIESAAFYGSLKCFKFLLLNIKLSSRNLAQYAIAGGNTEIIHICEQQKLNFRNTLNIAVAFHHNDVAQWIVDNSKDEIREDVYDNCIHSYNFDMLQFFLSRKAESTLNEDKFVTKYILYIRENYNVSVNSSKFNDFIMKYKSMKFVDEFGLIYCPNEKVELINNSFSDRYDKELFMSPVNLAAYNGDIEMCKFLINHQNIEGNLINVEVYDSEYMDYDRRGYRIKDSAFGMLKRSIIDNMKYGGEISPIFYAVQSGSLETVKYFLNEIGIEKQRGGQINPLHYAAILNLTEIGKLLLEKYDVNSLDQRNHTPLMYAIKSNSVDFIQFLLQQPDININAQDQGGLTPLHYTIIENDIVTFKQLFNSEKIDAFLIDNNNTTIWHYAAKYGRFDILKEIFAKTQDKINEIDKYGRTALMFAITKKDSEIFNFLIEYKDIDVNIKDIKGESILSLAMNQLGYRESDGNKEVETIISTLLSKKSTDVNIEDSDGETPIMIATRKENISVYRTLSNMKEINLNHLNKMGQNLMHLASKINDTELQKEIINNDKIEINLKDKNQKTPLHYAIQNEKESFLKELISKNRTDINIKDCDNNTPLMITIKTRKESYSLLLINHPKIDICQRDSKNNNYLHIACEKENSGIVTSLISKGVDINAKNDDGNTPLHIAIMRNDSKAVSCILKCGKVVSINERNEKGFTPLHIACDNHSYRSDGMIINQLLSYRGIDVNLQDFKGRSPIIIAQENHNSSIVESLIKDGRTNLNVKDKEGRSLLSLSYSNSSIFSMLVHRTDIDINTVDDSGYTPLHIAVARKDTDLVSYIVYSRRGSIPIDAKTKSGLSFMHLAAKQKSILLMNTFSNMGLSYNVQDNKGRTPLMVLINEKSPIIKAWESLLNKRSLDINLQDEDGWAIIHYAAVSEKSNILPSLFRRRDININLKTKKGETPMRLAMIHDNSKFVNFLTNDSRLNDESKRDKAAIEEEEERDFNERMRFQDMIDDYDEGNASIYAILNYLLRNY